MKKKACFANEEGKPKLSIGSWWSSMSGLIRFDLINGRAKSGGGPGNTKTTAG
jgi:hypothetical protein